MFELQFTTTVPEVQQLQRQTTGSFGYDLACSKDLTIHDHEWTLIPTGLYLKKQLPKWQDAKLTQTQPDRGLVMHLVPRSSLFMKYGLIITNTPAIIDADYTGEIKLIVYKPPATNISNNMFIAKGTRLAQAIFTILVFPKIEVVEGTPPKHIRGGFGSTGE